MIGELRGLLDAYGDDELTSKNFRDVLQLLLRWDDPATLDIAIDYADEHIQDWSYLYRGAHLLEVWPSFPDGQPHQCARLLDSLEFHEVRPFSLDDFKALTSTPLLANLEVFGTSNYKMVYDSEDMPTQAIGVPPPHGNQVLFMFANSPHLKKLRDFSLYHYELGPFGVSAFSNSPNVANLKNLNLSNNCAGYLGAKSIASSLLHQGLERLDLGSNNIGSSGAIAIAKSPYMSNLRDLSLWQNNIGDAGAIALAESPYMSNLRSLSLGSNGITTEGLRHLINSPHLRQEIRDGFDRIWMNVTIAKIANNAQGQIW